MIFQRGLLPLPPPSRLTVNVLPDLHLVQLKCSPEDSRAQVTPSPPQCRDGPRVNTPEDYDDGQEGKDAATER